MKINKKIAVLLFVLIPNCLLFAEDENINKAKEIVLSSMNNFGNNFLGDEFDYSLFDSKYFHKDFMFIWGDSINCNIVGNKINFEDIYYTFDDANFENPHEEQLLVVIVSYYLAGTILQVKSGVFEYREYNRNVVNKYYFSLENNELKIIDRIFETPIISYKDKAVKWAEKFNKSDEIISDLKNINLNENDSNYNFYNYDVMKYHKANDHWLKKSNKYYIKAMMLNDKNQKK